MCSAPLVGEVMLNLSRTRVRVVCVSNQVFEYRIVTQDDYATLYKQIKELGRGSFGRVFLVETEKGPFAAKEVDLAMRNIDRAPKEAMILGRANRVSSIARMHDSFVVLQTEEGPLQMKLVMIMDYIDGPTLKDFLSSQTTRHDILTIMRDLSTSLAELHLVGISHCDVKCANVLVCSETGRPKLIDFGLSKLFESEPSFSFGGTVAYYSPEKLEMLLLRARSKDLEMFIDLKIKQLEEKQKRTPRDEAMLIEFKGIKENIQIHTAITAANTAFKYFCESDVWALGAVFYRTIHGELPFEYMRKGLSLKKSSIEDIVNYCTAAINEIRLCKVAHVSRGETLKRTERGIGFGKDIVELVESIFYCVDPASRPTAKRIKERVDSLV